MSMFEPRILTVILNWRTADMTIKSAYSAADAMADVKGAITLVDNDSGDGSFEKMTAEFKDHPMIRVVQAGRNGGFGAGNNYGMALGLPDGSRPDFYYILNSDAFPATDAITKLRDYLLANRQVGLVGSYIYGEDGIGHQTCFRFPSLASEFEGSARTGPISRLLERYRVPLDIPDHDQKVDWLAGASIMIRARVLDQIGSFDEGFFLYFDETDLCYRAYEAGWETHFVRDSQVEHIGSVSTGMKVWRRIPSYWFDSRWRYFEKRGGRGFALLATLSCLAGEIVFKLRRLIQPHLRGNKPHFVRDLIAHSAKRIFTFQRVKSAELSHLSQKET